MAEGTAEWALASVDDRGRIVFPDPGDRESLMRLVSSFLVVSEFRQDPRALDVVLIHELVHVHQYLHLAPPAFYHSIRSRADLAARRAVVEGHAEYLTRRIASRLGLADTYEKYIRERTDPYPDAKAEFARMEGRIAAAYRFFPYLQGATFISAVVERLGYEETVRRLFRATPPSLAAISRPEEYFREGEPSRWGPVAEDLRRWLARERGEARIDVIGLPMVRLVAGDAAAGFREGFLLQVGLADVTMFVLIAEDDAAAQELHRGWTGGLERMHKSRLDAGFFDEVRLSREPDDWLLHYEWSPGHTRRNVIRAGNLIVDVECWKDSKLEQGAERLARHAMRFLGDPGWREAWLTGDKALLESEDPALRLAAVSRLKRFVQDEDWEVRWLGYFYEARDESRSKEERITALASAIEDPDPAVVTRGLRAVRDLRLWDVPWPLLRERLGHEEVAVRRAAWDLAHNRVSAAEGLALVNRALDDADVAVREEAADGLDNFHDEPGLLDVFRKALRDEHTRVRQKALIILANYSFQLPGLVPDITGLLDERPDLASEALGKLGPAAEPALPRLREVLKDRDGRAEAAMAIFYINGETDQLLDAVGESVAEGKPQGIEQLGELGSIGRPVVPDVATALAHKSQWIRLAAAKTLGQIGGQEAREALNRRLEVEKEPRVVEGIRKALTEFKDSPP